MKPESIWKAIRDEQKGQDRISPFCKSDDEGCIVERFFSDNPKATSVMISCPCRRCSPYTL